MSMKKSRGLKYDFILAKITSNLCKAMYHEQQNI